MLNVRFRKIASSEISGADFLFRDSCVITERNGDITRQPIGMKTKNDAELVKKLHIQGFQHLSNQYRGRNCQYAYPTQRGKGQRDQYRGAMKKTYTYNK